jgi:hypothetical protein
VNAVSALTAFAFCAGVQTAAVASDTVGVAATARNVTRTTAGAANAESLNRRK